MKLWEHLKIALGRLTLLELASTELAEAERKKMEAQTAVEYASALVAYRTAQIKRLKATINELSKEQKK
jgi:predicted Zn-dependent protease